MSNGWDEYLNEIEARYKAITPNKETIANALFIVGCRHDIPALVHHVRELTEALKNALGCIEAHEWAIRGDGGNSNFELAIAKSRAALAALPKEVP
jgi:hypothetical protein